MLISALREARRIAAFLDERNAQEKLSEALELLEPPSHEYTNEDLYHSLDQARIMAEMLGDTRVERRIEEARRFDPVEQPSPVAIIDPTLEEMLLDAAQDPEMAAGVFTVRRAGMKDDEVQALLAERNLPEEWRAKFQERYFRGPYQPSPAEKNLAEWQDKRREEFFRRGPKPGP